MDEEIINQDEGTADDPMTNEEQHRFDEFEDLRDRIEGLTAIVRDVLDAVQALQGITVESSGGATIEDADEEDVEVIVPLTELDFFDEIEGD